MNFSQKRTTLGKGRVSSARRMQSGETKFVIETAGALVLKTVPAGACQPVFSGSPEIVSYGDDCFMLEKGKLERRGGFHYEAY